jgi:peptidoglycan/LPS O-acetylase OafA/YrhL
LKRLHSLDALRAAMMLLGLVLHSGVSYITIRIPEAWPYQDRQTSVGFDYLVFAIHLFRMPTFFVMAGFFAAFLYYREGVAGFLVHRTRRVLLPFAIGWLIMFPLMRAGFVFCFRGGDAAAFDAAVTQLTSAPYATPLLGHLWFLEFLFIFCVGACVVMPILGRLPESLRGRVVAAFGTWAPTLTGCLAFAALSAVSMLPMSKPALDTSLTFLPIGRVLVAYTVFFAFGWLLFLRQDIVSAFARHPWRYCAGGLAVALAYLVVFVGKPFGGGWAYQVPGVATGGLAMWLLIYGVTGLFVRYFERPNSVQRYLSDASYWMYLIHLPLVIWLHGAMASWPVSPMLKFAITLAAVTLLTVVSYHYLVRATPIGEFLNGRRFERALPKLAPQPAHAWPSSLGDSHG